MSESNSSPVKVMDFRGTYKGGGGPDKTILHSAARHDKRIADVLVTYIRQPNDQEFLIGRLAAELNIEYTDVVDRSFLDLGCVFTIKKLIEENDIQLVHTHDDKTLLYGVLLRLLKPGLRLVHTCHSHAEYTADEFSSRLGYLKFLVRKKVVALLMSWHHKPVMTISENTRQRLITAGLAPRDVMVLHNGIDSDFWSRKSVVPCLRQELNIKGELLVGTVARITYDKDLPTFFQVVRQVVDRYPKVKFVIVGDGYGNELPEAREQAKAMGVGEVLHFTGHRTDLREVYASLDLFLMTSLTEGLPNTVLEAMAMEVPVVSTEVGGLPELVDNGTTGLLCPVGDSRALSDAVLTLLQDKALRQRYGDMARQRILREFDFGQRVSLLEGFYRDAVQNAQ